MNVVVEAVEVSTQPLEQLGSGVVLGEELFDAHGPAGQARDR